MCLNRPSHIILEIRLLNLNLFFPFRVSLKAQVSIRKVIDKPVPMALVIVFMSALFNTSSVRPYHHVFNICSHISSSTATVMQITFATNTYQIPRTRTPYIQIHCILPRSPFFPSTTPHNSYKWNDVMTMLFAHFIKSAPKAKWIE